MAVGVVDAEVFQVFWLPWASQQETGRLDPSDKYVI